VRLRTLKPVDPAARGANVGRRRPLLDGSPQTRLARAVQRFNASAEARTVVGLTRTLGVPRVSIGASAGSSTVVRITVVWELSWYQWGVDLHDEARPVFALAKGSEVGQLDGSARQWNASAVDGRLVLGAPRRND
jgi:hypothetical protein